MREAASGHPRIPRLDPPARLRHLPNRRSTSQAATPAEAGAYTTRPLDRSTWDAFAELVERNDGVYGGCWCIAFHTAYQRGVSDPCTLKEPLVRTGRAHAALVFDQEGAAQGWCQYGSPEELGFKHLREYLKDPAIRRLADHLHLRRQAAPGPRDRARRTRGAHWRRSRPPRAASSRRSRRLQPVARPKGASSSAQPSSCSSNTGSREGARSGNTRGSSAAASTAKRAQDALIEFDQRRPAQVVDRRATERPAFAGLCQSPSDGLEPSTPSLP
jgi:hypothetical protein